MSEAPRTILPHVSSVDLPLSVLLFHAAMQQNIKLSEFARQLGIGPLSLRQFISGQTQRPRSRTLEVLAEALGMSVDEVRHRAALQPATAPLFADWLKDNMNDGSFSRARLTRETGISDGALRNYLSRRTLPDSDQAQRLAEVLEIDSLELAKVLVADQTVRSGGDTISAEELELEDDNTEALSGLERDSSISLNNEVVGGLSVQSGSGEPVSLDTLHREEEHLVTLWRQLHPHGRRATLSYIATLLVER